MITSDRNETFMRLFARYNERFLLPRHLHSAAVQGAMYDGGGTRPVLFIMNHCSWWDGMLVFLAITRLSGYDRQHYVMMDEKQLKTFRFFRRLGAFSVDKSTRRGMVESLRYAEDKLKAGHNVWLFPQGDIRHLEARPLQFRSGAGYLLERCCDVAVQPVTVYYSFGSQQKPLAALCFGEPLLGDWEGMGRKAATEFLRQTLEKQLDAQKAASVAADGGIMEGYASIVRGSPSTSERFDAFKRRLERWTSFFGS